MGALEERIHPGNYMFARHLFAYTIAKQYAFPGCVVLDVGSGDGYGVAFLRNRSRCVVGVDRDFQSVMLAGQRYGGERIFFVCADASCLPVLSCTVDLACSMQVIEHLWDPNAHLSEIRRVLRPGAPLVLSTPYRDSKAWRWDKCRSPFHVVEYTAEQLRSILQSHFSRVKIAGVRFRRDRPIARTDAILGRVHHWDMLRIRHLIPGFIKRAIYHLVHFQPVGQLEMQVDDFECVSQIDSEVLDLLAVCL